MSQFREFAGQVVRALPDVGEAQMQRLISAPGELRRVLRDALAHPTLDEFSQAREGLWVSDSFRECILALALAGGGSVPAKVGNPLTIPPGGMTDAKIRDRLRADFPDAWAFCAMLAQMLQEQWGGTAGPLLTNGRANIFHVVGYEGGVFAVGVSWDSVFREWGVDADRWDDCRWDGGDRAFPCDC